MEDKNTYICGLRDEIEGKLWDAYNRGYDDGFEYWRNFTKAEEEYFSAIGKAFSQWIADKKHIVMRGKHNKENAEKFVYGVLSKIANGKEPETFRVGDEVVDNSGVVGVITRLYENEGTADVFVTDEGNYGQTVSGIKLYKMKKTGRHCDITLNW